MGDVRLAFTKWGGLPHWELDTVRLGSDEHGEWVGAPAGVLMSRPGVQHVPDYPQVTLLPRDGAFAATFYPPGFDTPEVYVDIATPPVWDTDEVRLVDLDLDVIRGWTGRVFIDDEDEFAQHRISLGYPDELVALARDSCDAVAAAVRAGRAPYDGVVGPRWLEALERVMMER